VPPSGAANADDGGKWTLLSEGGEVVGRVGWEQMRYSVSWKAYCFKDEAARQAWRSNADGLTMGRVLDTFRADLAAKGKRLPDNQVDVARALCAEYFNDYTPIEESLHVLMGKTMANE
jgi:hypothetical protein